MHLPSRIPLIQAPMAGAQGPALAAAVCRAGGLGSLPAALLTPARLREDIAALRAATDAPFNVSFFCHVQPRRDEEALVRWGKLLSRYAAEAGVDAAEAPRAPARTPFDAALCEVLEEMRPAVVSFHFGLPATDLLQRVKRTGALVLSSATTVAEARWLQAHGVDAIIAQGAEAGGHRGLFLSSDVGAQPGLFALLPQVVDAVTVPVIAAGGIADGRGIAAAFALGASAVQLGTAYLLTPEATTSAVHREALRQATDEGTRLTTVLTGRPARGLLNRVMRELGPLNALAPPFPLAAEALAPLRAAFEKQGRGDFSPLWAGESAALAREEAAEPLTRRLWAEAQQVAARLSL